MFQPRIVDAYNPGNPAAASLRFVSISHLGPTVGWDGLGDETKDRIEEVLEVLDADLDLVAALCERPAEEDLADTDDEELLESLEQTAQARDLDVALAERCHEAERDGDWVEEEEERYAVLLEGPDAPDVALPDRDAA